MNYTNLAVTGLLAVGICLGGCGAAAKLKEFPTSADAKAVRVGVFESRAVAIAWVRSEAFKTNIQEKTGEAKRAREAGNEARAKEIESEMLALQSEVHKQGFGAWPVKNILAQIEDELPVIASEAQVDVIVSRWDLAYVAAGAEFVDVTDPMVQAFSPDEATLKVIREIKGKPPVPIQEIEKHKH